MYKKVFFLQNISRGIEKPKLEMGDIEETLDWLQSLKQFFINVSYDIFVASLTLMALKTEPSELDWLQIYCFKDRSQSKETPASFDVR